MRVAHNPYQQPGPWEFHRSIPGYEPTPLHSLPDLAAELDLAALYVKDESSRFGLNAFKVLGASYAMSRFEGLRSCFSAATEGNHGRAVAWAARQMGAESVIFVPVNMSQARRDALAREGAEIVEVDGTYDDAVRQCAEQSEELNMQVISDTAYAGYTEIPSLIMDGYGTLFLEADEQLPAPPDWVYIQAGVGGLACAAARHYRRAKYPPKLVCVEPDAANCHFASIGSEGGVPRRATGSLDSSMSGLNCGEVSIAAWPEVRTAYHAFLTIEDAWAEEAVRRLNASTPRVIAGECGAAGLAGVLACRPPRQSSVLVINSEGATDPAAFERITGCTP